MLHTTEIFREREQERVQEQQRLYARKTATLRQTDFSIIKEITKLRTLKLEKR